MSELNKNFINYEEKTKQNQKKDLVSLSLPRLEKHKEEQETLRKSYTNNKKIIYYNTNIETKQLKHIFGKSTTQLPTLESIDDLPKESTELSKLKKGLKNNTQFAIYLGSINDISKIIKLLKDDSKLLSIFNEKIINLNFCPNKLIKKLIKKAQDMLLNKNTDNIKLKLKNIFGEDSKHIEGLYQKIENIEMGTNNCTLNYSVVIKKYIYDNKLDIEINVDDFKDITKLIISNKIKKNDINGYNILDNLGLTNNDLDGLNQNEINTKLEDAGATKEEIILFNKFYQNKNNLSIQKSNFNKLEKLDNKTFEKKLYIAESNYNLNEYIDINEKKWLQIVNNLDIFNGAIFQNKEQLFIDPKFILDSLNTYSNEEIIKLGININDFEELKSILESKIYIQKEIKKDYKKDNEDSYIKQKESKIKDTNFITDKDNYITNEDNYLKYDNGYTLKLKNGEKITGLSQEEKYLTLGNPETTKNIINFYKFFKDLNLEGVWKYRNELTLAMGNVNININDDSLKKSELLNFTNKLAIFLNNSSGNKATQINEKNTTLSGAESELRKLTGAGAYFDGKTFNINGEDIFTANLRKMGIIGGACFHTMRLRDILS